MILFLDLETTGLDPKRDHIIEVAVIATTDGMHKIGEFSWVVPLPEDASPIHPRVVEMHTTSGLWQAVFATKHVTIADVDSVLADLIRQWKGDGECYLAGNSVHFDRAFMVEHMPRSLAHLHYRQIDVSSLNEMAKRFGPKMYADRPAPQKGHRALADALESLDTARHYASWMENRS